MINNIGASIFPVLYITARDLYAQLKQRSFLVQTVILPLLLTFIIGNALGSNKTIEPVPVGVVPTQGKIADALSEVLSRTKIAKVSRPNLQQAQHEFTNGKMVALVELPTEIDKNLLHGKTSSVHVSIDPANPLGQVVVSQVVMDFFAEVEASRAATLGALAALKPEDAQTIGRYIPVLQASVQKTLLTPKIKISQQLANGRSAGFFTYYAVAFGIMFTMLTATNGASGLVSEFEGGTITRLLASPLAAWQLAFGKLASLFAITYVQMGIFMLATHFFFDVYWGSFWQLAVALPVATFGAAGLGGLVLALASSHEQVNVISLVLVLVMSLLGGSMWPIESMPATTQWLSRFTLNRWAIETFQTLPVPGMGIKEVWLNLIIMTLMGFIGFLFGARRLATLMRGLE